MPTRTGNHQVCGRVHRRDSRGAMVLGGTPPRNSVRICFEPTLSLSKLYTCLSAAFSISFINMPTHSSFVHSILKSSSDPPPACPGGVGRVKRGSTAQTLVLRNRVSFGVEFICCKCSKYIHTHHDITDSIACYPVLPNTILTTLIHTAPTGVIAFQYWDYKL